MVAKVKASLIGQSWIKKAVIHNAAPKAIDTKNGSGDDETR
jgi:hypothetical protein